MSLVHIKKRWCFRCRVHHRVELNNYSYYHATDYNDSHDLRCFQVDVLSEHVFGVSNTVGVILHLQRFN